MTLAMTVGRVSFVSLSSLWAASLTLSLTGCGAPTVDIAASRPCHDEAFPIPNPVSTGMPHPASYTVNGDDTVTDNVTTLTWERTVKPVTYHHETVGTPAVPNNVYTQAEAANHCAARGDGWRLPTRMELMTLVDFSIAEPGPTINQAAFPDTPVDFPYWTSTLHLGYFTAWVVDFQGGESFDRVNVDVPDDAVRAEKLLVRCVRWATPRCEPDRFQVQPGGLAYDVATGLTWQRYVSDGGAGLPWDYAHALCAGLGSGWRLPSFTELQSIVDDSRTLPAIDTDVFPTPSVGEFWAASADPTASEPGAQVFSVLFADGTAQQNPILTGSLGRVRCVH